jgi:hypothetical protein
MILVAGNASAGTVTKQGVPRGAHPGYIRWVPSLRDLAWLTGVGKWLASGVDARDMRTKCFLCCGDVLAQPCEPCQIRGDGWLKFVNGTRLAGNSNSQTSAWDCGTARRRRLC